jgi:hypothetical protein
MNDDQWAAQKLRELMERVRKAVLMEYGRRARELGLPWRQ